MEGAIKKKKKQENGSGQGSLTVPSDSVRELGKHGGRRKQTRSHRNCYLLSVPRGESVKR